MFERVLAHLVRPLLLSRIVTPRRRFSGGDTAGCIWENGIPYPNSSSEEDYEDDPDEWLGGCLFRTLFEGKLWRRSRGHERLNSVERSDTESHRQPNSQTSFLPRRKLIRLGESGSYRYLSTRTHSRSSSFTYVCAFCGE